MVTYFNRKDLVDFGKYLLSDARTEQIKEHYKDDKSFDVEARLKEVWHNEVENWIYERNKKVAG